MTKRQRLAAWYEKERRRAAVEVVTRRLAPQPRTVRSVNFDPTAYPTTYSVWVNYVFLP